MRIICNVWLPTISTSIILEQKMQDFISNYLTLCKHQKQLTQYLWSNSLLKDEILIHAG